MPDCRPILSRVPSPVVADINCCVAFIYKSKTQAFISNNQFIFIYIIATPRIFIFNHSFDIYTFILRAGNQYWFSSPTLDCCTLHYQTKTYIKIYIYHERFLVASPGQYIKRFCPQNATRITYY